jgi:hypothetical protein
MDDFTEDDLSKALGDPVDNVQDQLAKDLLDENGDKPDDKDGDDTPPADNPDGDAKGDDAADPAKDDTKPDDKNPDQPDGDGTKPDDAADPATEPKDTTPDQEPEMILGKFKTVDDLKNAYQNLEKKLGEKAQEVKEVKEVTSDEFDNAVRQKISEENWKLVDKAFETIADPTAAKEAQFLLAQFKKTGDGEYLEKARGYLDKRVDRKLEVDALNMAAKIQQTANAHRQEIIMKPLADELDKMAEEDPEFMNDKQNQDLMVMAIKLNPATVDVRAVKKTIKEYGTSQYQKGYEAAKKEVAKQAEMKAVSVKSVAKVETPKPKKPVDEMSIEEQLKEEYKDIPSIF